MRILRSWSGGTTPQIVWIILGVALLGASLHPGIYGDGPPRFQDLLRIAAGDVPREKYSLVQPFLSLPFYKLGRMIGAPEQVVAYFNYVLFVIMVAAFWLRLPAGRERFSIVILLMATSMFPNHLQTYQGEVLTASLCTIGFLLFERRPLVACILLAVGAANTPASLPALALALLFYALKTGRANVLMAFAFAVGLMVSENLLKFGTLLSAPYLKEFGFTTIMPYSGRLGFSYPLWFGVLSILFSFGKGLIFFVPGLLLRLPSLFPTLPKPVALQVDALLVFLLGMILVYAKWFAWYGGVFWGPRFFLIACVPASILLAYALSKRMTAPLFLILTLSVWVCAQGYLYGLADSADICVKNNYALEMLCWYTPEFSPLWWQFVKGFPSLDIGRAVFVAWSVCSVGYLIIDSVRRAATGIERA